MAETLTLRKAVACREGVNVTLPDWAYVPGPDIKCAKCGVLYEMLLDVGGTSAQEQRAHSDNFRKMVASEHPDHPSELLKSGNPKLLTPRRGKGKVTKNRVAASR